MTASCNTGFCGTGGWAGPLPGDPGEVYGLTATAVFGGVEVAWRLPNDNPHAVAFTTVYRGTNANFSEAGKLVEVSANRYLDQVPANLPATGYFYWVRQVSINGTLGNLVGPVSVTTETTVQQLLELLENNIDSSHLAQTLRGELARIDLLDNNLTLEQAIREGASRELMEALALVQEGLGSASALINAETATRISQNFAVVNALNNLVTDVSTTAASITAEAQARAAQVNAEVTNRVNAIAAETASRVAAIAAEAQRASESDEAVKTILRSEISLVANGVATNAEAYVQNYTYAKSTIDGAVASMGATLSTAYQAADAALRTETQAYIQTYAYAKSTVDEAIAATANNLTTSFQAADAAGITAARTYTESYTYSRSALDSSQASFGNALRAEFATADSLISANLSTNYYTKSAADSAVTARVTEMTSHFATNDSVAASIGEVAATVATANSSIASLGTTLRSEFAAADNAVVANTQAYVQGFTYTKTAIDSAVASSANTLNAKIDNNQAAANASISTVNQAVVDANASIASLGTSLRSEFAAADAAVANGINATLASQYYTKTAADQATAAQVDTLEAQVAGELNAFNASLSAVQTAVANTNSSVAATANTLRTEFANADAATYASAQSYVQGYAYSKTTVDSSIASMANTLRSEFAAGDAQTVSTVNATLTTNYYTKAAADQAVANAITSLQTSVGAAFTSQYTWEFSNTVDAWTVTGGVLVSQATSVQYSLGTADSHIYRFFDSTPGLKNNKVRARVRKTGGAASNWEGVCYYQVAGGHSWSTAHYKAIPKPANLETGAWVILEWDMANLDAGGADWLVSNIEGIRLDLETGAGTTYEVDWIALGRHGIPVSETAIANITSAISTGDTANATAIDLLRARVAVRPNIVPNGGFERTLPNGLPVGWSYYNYGGSGATAFLRDFVAWGRYISMEGPFNGVGVFISDQIPCDPGWWITVSGDSELVADSGNTYIDVVFLNAANGVVGQVYSPRRGPHSFSTDSAGRIANEGAAQAPAGTAKMQVRCVYESVVNGTRAAFRQIKLEYGTLPSTPYTSEGSAVLLDAAIKSEAVARASAIDAQATQITTLQSRVNNAETGQANLVASLQQEATTRANVDGGLLAQWTVKTDLNGYVSGFGLSSTANNSAPVSNFIVTADRFSISSPFGPGIAPVTPFIVNTTPVFENGVTIPAGVYMNGAYIRNLTADRIDTRGMTIKDASGNTVFSANVPPTNLASGANLLYNSDFAMGRNQGWAATSKSSGALPNLAIDGLNGAGADWRIARGVADSTATFTQLQSTGAYAPGHFYEVQSDPVPVQGSRRFIASIYSGAHRCLLNMFMYVYDVNGNVLQAVGAGESQASNAMELSGGGNINDFKRLYCYATMPSNASYVKMVLRKFDTYSGYSDSWAMWTRGMIEEAAANATAPGAWNVSSNQNINNFRRISAANASTFIENAAIQTAQIGDAAIVSAKIGTAEIGSLKIAGQAVQGIFSASAGAWGLVTKTITVTSDDIPYGASTVPIVITACQVTENTVTFFDMAVNQSNYLAEGNIVAALPPNPGLHSYTHSHQVGPGTYTYACFNHGAGDQADGNTRQRTITVQIGKR